MKPHGEQIAIDGPAASGKSTVARLVADRLGAVYVNTGDMYRTITWAARRRNINPETDPDRVAAMVADLDLQVELDANGKPRLLLDGHPVRQADIRSPDVAAAVSYVARIPEVRAWLLRRQRDTRRLGTVVMEGRDIGTVIFPDAKYKFFLTASPEVRARRRLAQADEVPLGATVASVAADIAQRDRIDSTRAVAPLKPADDAVIIDTDSLTAGDVADAIADAVRNRS